MNAHAAAQSDLTVSRELDIPDWAGIALVQAASGAGLGDVPELVDLPERVSSRRRVSFIAGRMAARSALMAANLPIAPIRIGPSGQPKWPAEVVGSISHSRGAAIALVAPAPMTQGVGVDIETLRPVPEITGLVASPEEVEWIRQSDSPDTTLLRLFAAKECIFKAFFPRVNRWFGFETASLRPTETGFEGRLLEQLDDEYPPERTFHIGSKTAEGHLLTWLILPSGPAVNTGSAS